MCEEHTRNTIFFQENSVCFWFQERFSAIHLLFIGPAANAVFITWWIFEENARFIIVIVFSAQTDDRLNTNVNLQKSWVVSFSRSTCSTVDLINQFQRTVFSWHAFKHSASVTLLSSFIGGDLCSSGRWKFSERYIIARKLKGQFDSEFKLIYLSSRSIKPRTHCGMSELHPVSVQLISIIICADGVSDTKPPAQLIDAIVSLSYRPSTPTVV